MTSTSAFRGPWTSSPPACNSTAQCQTLLAAAFPSGTLVGLAACFPNLKPENASSAIGGCACEGSWGLGGPTCAEQTGATPASIAIMVVSLVVSVLAALRFLPVLVGLVLNPRKGIFKINAAGTTYIFTWIGLFSTIAETSANVAKVTVFDNQHFVVTAVTGRMRIIFLAICVLNLVAAFVEMSSSVRLFHNVDKLRIPVIVTVFVVASSVVLTYLLASTVASTILAFVVVLILANLGVYGPALMYVRSSNQMAATNNTKPLSKWELFLAIQGEICCGGRHMKRALGITHSSSSGSKDSKDESKGSREASPEIPSAHLSPEGGGGGVIRVGSSSLKDHSSRPNLAAYKRSEQYKREAKMIDFLSRAVRMGFWLAASLVDFLIGAAFSVAIAERYNGSEEFRRETIAQLVQDLSMASAFYQILWFLDLGYRKALRKHYGTSLYRSETKDVVMSKEMVSKDESKIDPGGDQSTREEGGVRASQLQSKATTAANHSAVTVRPE